MVHTPYGKSSFFPEGEQAPSNRAPPPDRQNPVEEIFKREALVQSSQEIRYVTTPWRQHPSRVQWEKAHFVPGEFTRAAFERYMADGSDLREKQVTNPIRPMQRSVLTERVVLPRVCLHLSLSHPREQRSGIPSRMVCLSMSRR